MKRRREKKRKEKKGREGLERTKAMLVLDLEWRMDTGRQNVYYQIELPVDWLL